MRRNDKFPVVSNRSAFSGQGFALCDVVALGPRAGPTNGDEPDVTPAIPTRRQQDSDAI
jgi:hypothetical protein